MPGRGLHHVLSTLPSARTNLYSPTLAYNQSRAQENVKCYAVGTFRDGGANKSLAHTDYGYAPSY